MTRGACASCSSTGTEPGKLHEALSFAAREVLAAHRVVPNGVGPNGVGLFRCSCKPNGCPAVGLEEYDAHVADALAAALHAPVGPVLLADPPFTVLKGADKVAAAERRGVKP